MAVASKHFLGLESDWRSLDLCVQALDKAFIQDITGAYRDIPMDRSVLNEVSPPPLPPSLSPIPGSETSLHTAQQKRSCGKSTSIIRQGHLDMNQFVLDEVPAPPPP